MRPDDKRHGTEAGHEQHVRDGEDPCTSCREAKLTASRRRSKRKAMGYAYQVPLGRQWHRMMAVLERGGTYDHIAAWSGVTPSQIFRFIKGGPDTLVYARTWVRLAEMVEGPIVTPIGVTRRIQALMWLGYSAPVIAAEAGCNLDTIRNARFAPRDFMAGRVAEGVVAAYERLSMTYPTGVTQQDRAGVSRTRNMARRRGWHPPLAWDDIDHPAAKPMGTTGRHTYLAAELVSEWEHLRSAGVSLHHAAQQLGVSPGAIEKAIERHGKDAA